MSKSLPSRPASRPPNLAPASVLERTPNVHRSGAATAEHHAGKNNRSIVPWLFSIPILVWDFLLLLCRLTHTWDKVTMKESVPLMRTWQGYTGLAAALPLLIFSSYMSSMCDGVFNGDVKWPRAEVFNFALAMMSAALWCLVAFPDVNPLYIGSTNWTWPMYTVTIMSVIPLIYATFRRLRIALVQRERLKKGPAKYLKESAPTYGIVAVVQLCIITFQVAHATSYPTTVVLKQPVAGLSILSFENSVCSHVNATYVRRYCVESEDKFEFLDIEMRGPHGFGALRCADDMFPEDVGVYTSLFYACRGTRYSHEIILSVGLIICSAILFFSLVFREFIAGIDDQMDVWNFVERARNWETRTGTTRANESWSTVRIILAVVLAAVGFLGLLLCVVAIPTFMMTRNAAVVSPVAGVIVGFVIILWILAFVCLVLQFRHRKRYALEETPEAKEALYQVQLRIDDELERGVCRFWFLKADYVRNCKDSTLPRFQDLKPGTPDSPLEPVDIRRRDALTQSASLANKFCVVSHRWLDPLEPDKGGVQFRTLKAHLNEPMNAGVEYVWYDFSCMPQGEDRTRADQAEFRWMLKNVNLLYLSCSVLALVDLSYSSRFWTQFESWLGMQLVSASGLSPAQNAARRCTFIPIWNANEQDAMRLVQTWEHFSPEQAHDMLALPDVVVTNASDKDMQLPKLLQLDEEIRQFFASA